ncbi:hypothetical protein ACTXT7_016154 [Hymenolepis weldensis]
MQVEYECSHGVLESEQSEQDEITTVLVRLVIYAEEEATQMLYKLAYEFPATLRTSIRFSIGLLVIIGTWLFLFAIYLKCVEQRKRRIKSQEEHAYRMN